MILTARPADKSEDGFNDWGFMSIHQLGENPAGTWTVRIIDTVSLIPHSPPPPIT